jgi:cell division protein FtsL
MTEYYTVKRIDNSRLARPKAPDRLRDCTRRVACATVFAACCLLYAWQHFQCIQLRYELEDLQSKRGQAVELNQHLRLEIAGLRAPMRIDSIARNQLGLTVPVPGQVAPVEGPNEPVVAQASVVQTTRP